MSTRDYCNVYDDFYERHGNKANPFWRRWIAVGLVFLMGVFGGSPAYATVYEYFVGTVTDSTGTPINSAMVQINEAIGQTNSGGLFAFHAIQTERYAISVISPGYALASQIEYQPTMGLSFTLKPVEEYTIDPSVSNPVTDSRNTQIQLTANSLVDPSTGLPASEPVTVQMYTYDLQNEPMPGDMNAINSAQQPVYLESAGAFWVEFVGDSGTKYELDPNKPATISVPAINEEPTIGLWYYDKATGNWKEDGSASLVQTPDGPRLEGSVNHFSAWNFDWQKSTPACVKFVVDQSIFDDYGKPLNIKAAVTSPAIGNNPPASNTRTRNADKCDDKPYCSIINIPPYSTVDFYIPSTATTPYASINAGAAWGGTGTPSGSNPSGNNPYDPYETTCKAKITFNSPMFPPIPTNGYACISGTGKNQPFSWALKNNATMAFDANNVDFTTAGSASNVATLLNADMIHKGVTSVSTHGNCIDISGYTLYVGAANDPVSSPPMCELTTTTACSFNPTVKLVTEEQMLTMIRGFVWDDVSGNGAQDSNESYLEGWTVVLTYPNDSFNSTVTDIDGYYEFTNLSAGDYTITVETRTGFTYTTQQSVTRTVSANNNPNPAIPDVTSFGVQPTQFNLTINKTGSGTISATGIDCGSDCSESYFADTQVTLTGTPDSGFEFTNWSGDCTGTNTSVTVTMDAAKSCTANFASTVQAFFKATTYPTGPVCVGEPVTLTYGVDTTRAIHELDYWLTVTPTAPITTASNVSGQSLVSAAPGGNGATINTGFASLGTLAVFSAYTLSTMKIPQVDIPIGSTDLFTVTFTPVAAGTITLDLNAEQSWSRELMEDTGFYFSVLPDPLTQGSEALQLTVSLCDDDGDGMSNAFENTYGLDPLDPSDAAGDLDGDTLTNLAEYTLGTRPDLTDTDGDSFTDDVDPDPLDPLVPGGPAQVKLTVNNAGGGTVSGSGIDCGTDCDEFYDANTDVTLTAVPASGVAFVEWRGACTGTNPTVTVAMGISNQVCVANFSSGSQFDLTVSTIGEGTVAGTGIDCGNDCSEPYNPGTAVMLTALPASGYAFVEWTGACTGTNPTATVTMNAHQGCAASFAPISPTTIVVKPTAYPAQVCTGDSVDLTYGVETTRNISELDMWLNFAPDTLIVNGGSTPVSGSTLMTEFASLGTLAVFRALRPSTISPPQVDIPAGNSDLFTVNFTPTHAGTVTFSFDADSTWTRELVEIDGTGFYESAPPDPLPQTNLSLQLTVSDCVAINLPQIVYPLNNGTLADTTESFTWQGSGIQQWWLYVGNTPGGKQYFDSGSLSGTTTGIPVTGLPADGSTVYARLWYHNGQNWQFVDYSYAAYYEEPAIVEPIPDSILGGSDVTFTWQGGGILQSWLYIGTQPGSTNLFDSGNLGSALTVQATGLPTDGRAVYVRLWYDNGQGWQYLDYSYTAGSSGAPTMTPVDGSVLTGSNVTFSWQGTGLQQSWLYIGTALGASNLLNSGNLGTATSVNATGLPVGSTVYVRLWYDYGGGWQRLDYIYTTQ